VTGPGSPPRTPANAGRDKRSGSSAMSRAVRRAASGVLIVVAGMATYVWFYGTHQRSYLTGRNQRTLASLSQQVGEKLRSTNQLLRSAGKFLADSSVVDSAADFVPAYRHLGISGLEKPAYVAANAQACVAVPMDSLRRDGKWRHDPHAPASCVYRSLMVAIPPDTILRLVFAHLNLASYLQDDFQARIFDKAVIVDTSGLVLVQAGSPAVVLSRLDAVIKGMVPTARRTGLA
jgi:hypothetical protein